MASLTSSPEFKDIVEFHESMDPYSLDVFYTGRFVGFLQWHNGLGSAEFVVMGGNVNRIPLLF